MEKSISRNGRVASFSYMRVLACIGIVVLHTFDIASGIYQNEISIHSLYISKTFVYEMMWAVPLFVMITGSLLLDKNKSISYEKLFKKYILRIFKALCLFVFIYLMFDTYFHNEPFTLNLVIQYIKNIFTASSWGYLWYLYLLIGIYLLLPMYKKIVNSSNDFDIRYLLLIYFLFLSIVPILKIWGINCGFYIHVATIYPFYLFLGYAIHNNMIKINDFISFLLLIVSTVIIGILSNTYYLKNPTTIDLSNVFVYSSTFVVLQATSIFSLLDHHFNKENKVVDFIDSNSFGIYLIHPIFLRYILKYYPFNPYLNNGILSFILLICIVFMISLILNFILKKIPGLKNIL